MHKHGGDIYRGEIRMDFSANINCCGMPESVRRAACEGVRQSEHYPDPECEELRAALAEKTGVSMEKILCGNGAADLIYTLALAEKPRRALVCAPTFFEYEQALTAAGCRVCRHFLREEEDFAYTEEILTALTEDVDIFFLCNPNNPTGELLAPGLLRRILEICEARRIRLVVDECFLDFFEEKERYAALPYLAEFRCLIVLRAFTKLYAMPGLRLGYLMTADPERMRRLSECRQPWSVSLPAQMAGVAALSETEYVRESLRRIRGERERLARALGESGAKVYDSAANYLFFRARPRLAEDFGKRGILIRDCSNLPGLTEGYYRIAVRSHEENTEWIRVFRSLTEE